MKNWDLDNIKKLFEMVELTKKENQSLLTAFENFAVMTNRKKNSVRNFYYAMLRELIENPNKANEMNIDLTKHIVFKQKFFSEEETKDLVSKISEITEQGVSVRNACYQLSNGDVKLMLRLQNKYQVMKKNNENRDLSNVVIMPEKQNKLSDDEIKSLLMGIVRLIQNSVREELSLQFENDINFANSELRKSIKDLANKEKEIKMLRKHFEVLKNEKEKLKQEVQMIRCESSKISGQIFPEKINSLKTFFAKNEKSPINEKV